MGAVWRFLIIAAFAIGGAVLWYNEARTLALLVAPIDKIRVYSKSVTFVGWDGGRLTIDGREMILWNPSDIDAFPLTVDSHRRLVATINGRAFVLGIRHGLLSNAQDAAPTFVPEPGDKVRFTFDRSWIIWPNWFEMNFMTGQIPTWKRFAYYHLAWHKRSGETLDVYWLYEHYWWPSNGSWLDADMSGPGCGLVRFEIH